MCRMHGGSAPQVKAAAKLRLAALVDPAIDQLTKLLKSQDQKVQLGAVKDVLDRAGLKPTEKVEVDANVKAYDVAGLATLSDAELNAAIAIARKLTDASSSGSGAEETGEE